jgi:hypothetical protein
MKKIQLVIFWIAFFFLSSYALIQVDKLYVHSKVPVSLPMMDYFLTMWESGYTSVTGTIRGKDDDYYEDLNVIKAECTFSEKQCTHSVAGVFGMRQFSDQPLLNVKLQTFRIVQWNKELLVYKDIGLCYETTFTLLRDTKSLTGITKYSKNNSTCRRNDEVTFTIINGFDYVQSQQKESRNVAVNVLLFLLVAGISLAGIYSALRPKS